MDGIVKKEQGGKIYTLWVLEIKEFEMESAEYLWSENVPAEEQIIEYMESNGYDSAHIMSIINAYRGYEIYPVYAERIE